MEPFHEVQITLCVFNKTNDKNLKSPDAQTLNAPWSIVRHCESYCVVLRFAFSSDKRNILFSVLTTWLTTQGRVSHFVLVSGGPWYILRVWFWCHQMSLYDVSSPLPPCAWRPDSRTSWLSSPPWPSRWPCTDSPCPGSGPRLRGQRPRPHSPRGWQRPGARSPPAPASLSPKVTDPMRDRIFTGGEEGRDNSIKEQLKVSAWGSQTLAVIKTLSSLSFNVCIH